MAFRFSRKRVPERAPKIRLKKGDLVEIITGKDKGKRGKLLEVIRATGRVVVQGANMIHRHTRPNPQRGIKGGIVEREGSIHHSNVMIVSAENNKRTRIGMKVSWDGKTRNAVRVARRTGEVLDK